MRTEVPAFAPKLLPATCSRTQTRRQSSFAVMETSTERSMKSKVKNWENKIIELETNLWLMSKHRNSEMLLKVRVTFSTSEGRKKTVVVTLPVSNASCDEEHYSA
jgi:NMD protein affecting ribosome stability and mRNA decay